MPGGPGTPDQLTASLHYGRAGRAASSRRQWVLACSLAVALLAASHAAAQYPGQVDKKDKDKEAPSLRAVAVLEWTGDLTKPKTSRLVPITVYDGEQLQDAGVYMARPEPMSVADGVEYILQKNGAKLGLYDVEKSGQEQGSWVGFGAWKPMPKPKVAPAVVQKIDEDDEDSDRPVLHRKHGSGSDASKNGSGDGSGAQGPPPDPDRPTLHKAPDASQAPSQSSGSETSNAPADPDRPTLHKAPDASQTSGSPSTQSAGQTSPQTSGQPSGTSSTASSTPAASDPDRPQLKHGKAKQQADEGYVSSVGSTDPDRPRLLRGKPAESGPAVTPTLMGLPSDMEQAVAVSDPRNRPEHPWSYSWANLDDEAKMKAAMEDAARTALGIQTPPPAPKKTSATRAKAKPAALPTPVPLVDEEFRVFELAYGAGATLVLTAHTDGPPNQQKYVTLIGQPDLYGSLLVLFKNVADGAHLDDSPRMRLVDAVDALADNRGELLFELRGKTQRQFALYRVLRGTATQLFVTGGGATAIEAQN